MSDYEGYSKLLHTVTAWREFREQWAAFQLMQLLHGAKSDDVILPAKWFLEALQDRHYAAERQFWDCVAACNPFATVVSRGVSTVVAFHVDADLAGDFVAARQWLREEYHL